MSSSYEVINSYGVINPVISRTEILSTIPNSFVILHHPPDKTTTLKTLVNNGPYRTKVVEGNSSFYIESNSSDQLLFNGVEWLKNQSFEDEERIVTRSSTGAPSFSLQKIIGTHASEKPSFESAFQGRGVALSYDGLTMATGSVTNQQSGCAFVFHRLNLESPWLQEAHRLSGEGGSEIGSQGFSVALSGDGNTLVVGAPLDDKTGSVFIYNRSYNASSNVVSWSQFGSKLRPTCKYPTATNYGFSVAISRDASTIAVGSPGENYYGSNTLSGNEAIGATYIYILVDNRWIEQRRLVGGVRDGLKSSQGACVALSRNGDTLAVKGYGERNGTAETFVFQRANGGWGEEEHEAFFFDENHQGANCQSVTISGDGNLLVIGGYCFYHHDGVSYCFAKKDGKWSFEQEIAHGHSNFLYRTLPYHTVRMNDSGSVLAISTHADVTIPSLHLYQRVGGWIPMCEEIIVNANFEYIPHEARMALSGDGKSCCLGFPTEFDKMGGVYCLSFRDSWSTGPLLQASNYVSRAGQGNSISLSPNGLVLAIGGKDDENGTGAVWVFTRASLLKNEWRQYGEKLTGSNGNFGNSVALSSEGDTLVVGCPGSNGVFIYKLQTGLKTYKQIGEKLGGRDVKYNALQGSTVSISSDGLTLAVGCPYDDEVGSIVVFNRSNANSDSWVQKFNKMIIFQPDSLHLSGDGMTLVVGCRKEDLNGVVKIFTRIGDAWSQDGQKLTGSDKTTMAFQGSSVSLSYNGKVLAFGGIGDHVGTGAVWIFNRVDSGWVEVAKLVGSSEYSGMQFQGRSVCLSGDGNRVIFGGDGDGGNIFGIDGMGACWIFNCVAGSWIQQGEKMVGNECVKKSGMGSSVTMSRDGSCFGFGGASDNEKIGACWVGLFSR